jgi:hypothetical protein
MRLGTRLNSDLRRQLGIALNESTLLGFEVDPASRIGAATLSVLTLPETGPAPADRRIQILFFPVGRVVASLREGPPEEEKLVPFGITELLTVVQSFGGLPIYGWEFFDIEDSAAGWRSAPSLDWFSGAGGSAHSITVFQEGPDRLLDLSVWFDELEIRTPTGEVVPISEFAAGGKRWCDGLYAGDERTQDFGIVPGKPPDA